MKNNSYGTNTNIQFGSNELENFWLNATQCSIPGISFSPPEIDGRTGKMFTLPADNVVFSDLVITVLLDKDWEIFDLIYNTFLNMIDIEKGTFYQKKFDMWLQIKDGTGKNVKKFDFYGVRLMDVGEFDMDTRDIDDSNIEIILTFRFDTMDFNNLSKMRNLD